MNPSSIVLQTVRERLKEAAKNNQLGDVRVDEISSNPEDRPPATAGQKWVSANLSYLNSEYINDTKWTYYRIHVSYIVRVREIPNDRFEDLFIDDVPILKLHDDLMRCIPTYTSLLLLKQKLAASYNVKNMFKHSQTTLQPTPLYPSFFGNTVANTNSKIAGFKTTAIFTSPAISDKTNLQLCT
jgi:hypothetical protein